VGTPDASVRTVGGRVAYFFAACRAAIGVQKPRRVCCWIGKNFEVGSADAVTHLSRTLTSPGCSRHSWTPVRSTFLITYVPRLTRQ
jgi:hypothetical protein